MNIAARRDGTAVSFVGPVRSVRCGDYQMDRLETDPLFWKRESAEERDAWIEPTAMDLKDRVRGE